MHILCGVNDQKTFPELRTKASCKHRVVVTVTKGSLCAKIESVIPRTPRCRMGSSPDLEFCTRTACQSAKIRCFSPYVAAHRNTRERSAFPEASHPVGEHAAGACALPASSPGGPRSSAPTWPPLPRRLERLNRPARPRCHSTLRSTLAQLASPASSCARGAQGGRQAVRRHPFLMHSSCPAAAPACRRAGALEARAAAPRAGV
mgnify:CR=1 FL=1